jgi:diguanylate cyclase (GGDEF)-like protein
MDTAHRPRPALHHDVYRGPRWWPLRSLSAPSASRGTRRIAAIAVALNAAAVVTAILNVELSWNGVPVPFGPPWLDVTIYPPLLISVVAAVWLGPTWGIVPAYLANVTSAAWSGIPPATSAVFALAGAVETAVIWGSMVTLNIAPDLTRKRDLARFVAVSLTAPAVSSLAVLIWNTALGLDFVAGQRVWRGWVVGDFLLLALVALPLFRFAGPAARTWIDRQFATPPHQDVPHARSALFASVVVGVMGALFVVGMLMLQHSLDVPPDTRTASGELLRPRLEEIQFFVVLVVAALVLTTATFSTGLARMGERQRAHALYDNLTGCLNRRAFYERFAVEADRSRRLRQGLALLFVDVDFFKAINDRFGHEVGDHVLQQLALRLQAAIRDTDLLFRWGGEEFVVLLAHTSLDDARAVAERVRADVAASPVLASQTHGPIELTLSVGIAASATAGHTPDDLVARADAACYRAKAAGRDAVATHGSS